MTEKATRKAIRAALRALAKVSMAAAPSSKNQFGSNEFLGLANTLMSQGGDYSMHWNMFPERISIARDNRGGIPS